MEILPYHCPDDPQACGYHPQYQVGTPATITFRVYSNTMGVRVEADQTTVEEGTAATFTFHRHGGKPDSLTRQLHMMVQVTQDGDYISGAAPQTVTFAGGQATATLTLPTLDDAIDEADGSITVEILRPTVDILGPTDMVDDQYGYRYSDYPGSPWREYTVTTGVTDNELPGVSVKDAIAYENEGAIKFTVSLERPNTENAASVDWATSDDGSTAAATSGVDYTAASGTLNFAIGETKKKVTVTLLDDELDENHETFNLVLSNASQVTLADSAASGTILDDELAFAVIFGTTYSGSVEEGEDVVLRVNRLPPKKLGEVVSVDDHCYEYQVTACFDSSPNADTGNVPLTVNVRVTQEGNFISGTAPTTVHFEPDSVFAFLTIPTDDDMNIEPDGLITAEVLNGAGYSPLYLGEAENPEQNLPTVIRTVHDNDLTFSIADAQAGESAGQMDFTVSLNVPATKQVTIDAATVDGDATSHAYVTATSLGKDFDAKTETITFEVGEQQKTFSVTLENDRIHERDETFTVQLSNPSEYTTLADDTAVGTIQDDEATMVASVSRTYSIVNENLTGPVRFNVELAHANTIASERNPAVAWQVVAGTATEGLDYQEAGGKVTFPVGTTNGIIEVNLVDDNLLEQELETFTVELMADGTRLVEISPAGDSFETSIKDNESLTAAITANADSVAEGDETTFTVTLNGAVTNEPVSVEFYAAGTASATLDYATPTGNLEFPPGNITGNEGTLLIPAGQYQGTITYPILTDSVQDGEETLEVGLFAVTSGARSLSISQTQSVATTTILDQDSLTVSVEGSPSVEEGGAATFTIRMSTTDDEDVSVGWSTRQAGDTRGPDETATPDIDFTAESGTVAIPPGSTSATITVQTTEDTLVEGDETFLVELDEAMFTSANPPEMIPLGVTSAHGAIVDNDTAPTGLTISVDPTNVSEDAGATDLSVTVGLDGATQFPTDTPVTVEMVNRPGVTNNAELGVDYTATTSSTVIPAGDPSVTTTITITPVDDTYSEATEIARLSAKSPALAGSAATRVNITDNDVEPIEVSLAVSPNTVNESATSVPLSVTATFVGQSSRQIDTLVNLELTADTAALGDDFQAATGTLTIPAGQTSAAGTLILNVLDDNIAEGSETLKVAGEAPGSIQVTPAVVTILDNDTEPNGIGLSAITGALDEAGGTATIPVQATLLGGGTRNQDTLIALSVTGVTATAADDYTASWNPAVLTIPAGDFDATATLTLTLVDDTIHEDPEQLAVRGDNADPGLPVNGVRLTIVDNDPAPTAVNLSLSDNALPESGNHLPDIYATLVGDSTLTSDIEISITIGNSALRAQPYGGGLLAPLTIAAGESTGESFMSLRDTDDDVEDADETIEIHGTTNQPGLIVNPARVTIINDDTSGISLSKDSLTVREGRRSPYAVWLDSEPTGTVVVTVDVPANAGFTVNPGTLTFTPQSWGTQQVLVSGTLDPDGDDEPPAVITHSISSSDLKYNSASAGSVTVTVRDTSTAQVTVSPTELTIPEGGSDTYTVSLDTEPTGDVTVTIGGAGTDLSLDSDTLTFTTVNWATSQTVTVTANEDANAAQDSHTLTHTVSGGGYDGITADDVVATITDNDTAGVTIEPTEITVVAGRSNEYTVVLDTEPTGSMVVSAQGYEGTGLGADDPVPVFNATNWSTAKTVRLTALEDAARARVRINHIAAGGGYDGVLVDDVMVTLLAAPSGALVQVGVTTSDQALTVGEGQSETYTVVLGHRPAGDVTVTLGGVSNTDVTLNDSTLTFTQANWNAPQTVTVTAAHDGDAWDDTVTITHTVASAADTAYDGLSAESVVVTVTDDDTAGVTISETSLTIEEGNTGAYTVVLDTKPTGNVTVTVSGLAGTDVSLDKTTLTFTDQNWGTAQTVTVTAVDDDLDEDSETVTLTHTVASAANSVYDGVTAADLDVEVTDNDTAGVTVSEASLTIEEGSTGTYTVVLDTKPTGNVTVTISGHAGTDASLDKTTLTFTGQNWSTAQTVTVTAQEDDDSQDETDVTLAHTVSSTADTDYNGISAGSVRVSITDNDTAGVTISDTALTIREGNTGTYTIVLDTEPTGNVTVTITDPTDNTDVTADPASLTFTTTDWNTAQTVTVTAAQDGDAADETATVTHTAASTADPAYQGISIDDVAITLEDNAPDTLIVNFKEPAYDADEGASVDVTVTLDLDPQRTITILLTHVGQGGASSADYSGVPASVEFNPGDTEKTFSFAITADDVDDDAESVKLGFVNLPTGVSEGSIKEALVSIIDDDVPSVTVSFEQATYTAAEGGTVDVKVKLNADPERTVIIPITKTNQGGATSADYSVLTSVTFNSGDTEETIIFSATADSVDDDDESVRLTFGTLPDLVTPGTTSDTVVSITDDDFPELTVFFTSPAKTVQEGEVSQMTMALSIPPEREVTIPLTFTNQGGATSADYSMTGSVTFGANQQSHELHFTATQDFVDDDGESVLVGLGSPLPQRITPGHTPAVTVTITDDDTSGVTVSESSLTILEGNNDTYTVVLNSQPTGGVTVETSGHTGTDVSLNQTTLTFTDQNWDRAQTMSVTAEEDDDSQDETDVTLVHTVSSTADTDYHGITAGSVTVTITDNDDPRVEVSFEQAAHTVAESDDTTTADVQENQVTIKVKLSADPERTVVIPVTKAPQGGATAADYSGVPGNVTFNAGDTEETFIFSATADTVNDDGESVKLGFGSALPARVTAGSVNESVVSITDDDLPSITVSFEQAAYTVAEGNSVTVKVKLSADPERSVTIPISRLPQGTTSPGDYSGVPLNLTFASEETEKDITFVATQDTHDDDGESVKLEFGSNLPTGISEGTTNETVVSITDDDVPAVAVSFEQSTYTVAEGSTTTVKVKLNADPERTVTIPVNKAPQGGATSADYSGVPLNIVFNSGDTEKTFTFSATADSVDDDGESVKLTFGTLPTGVSEGTTKETVVSITDDDVPSVTVSFEQAAYTVTESDDSSTTDVQENQVTIKVKLSAGPERTVTIPITKAPQDGASAADYSGVPGNLTFNSEDTEKTITFIATHDTVDDDGESVKLGFGTMPTGVTPSGATETTISITDDDVPRVTVSFGAATYSVAEGTAITVTVELSADPERTINVPILVTPIDGASPDDFSGVPENVTLNSGDTEKTFSFSATQDTEDDDGERVMLTFGDLPARVTSTGPSQAVVSITDDDLPADVNVSFGQTAYTVPESDDPSTTDEQENQVTIKVKLSEDPERTITVPITKTNQDGATSADYSGVPENITFNSGDTEKTITFQATHDTVDDDGESVKLGLGTNLPSGVSAGTPSETLVSITDDDHPTVNIRFKRATYTAPEGGTQDIKIVLNADPERTLTFTITKTNQGGASNSDYSVPGSVTFHSGDTEMTIAFSATADSDDDDGESVKLGFGTMPAGAFAANPTEATVNITDDDYPAAVTVSYAAATYTAPEGGSAQVKVTLSPAPERQVVVLINRANQDGASNSDYSGVPTSLTFGATDTEKTFTFAATDDSDNDDGESVKLTFGTLPPDCLREPTTKRWSQSPTPTYPRSPSASRSPPTR